MVLALVIASGLVGLTIVFHYEVLRLISGLLSRLTFALLFRIVLVVLGCFAAHLAEIFFYTAAYLVIDAFGLGSLQGHLEDHVSNYLYFSAISYSTLGVGDVYPARDLRHRGAE